MTPDCLLYAEYAYYFGISLVLLGLIRWFYELLMPPSTQELASGASTKLLKRKVLNAGEETAGCDAGDEPRSFASGFLDAPSIEEANVNSKRAVCGLFPSAASTPTVEQFGACLQRMIRACHDKHGQLRIFDDNAVNDSMDGNPVSLTECRATQFRRMRLAARLTEEEYIESMCARPFSGGKVEASGKSGSFFLRTHDNRFVLKTIELHEFIVLKDILPHMVLYLMEHERSLLCRFLGGYELKIGGRILRFIVMVNVLPRHADEVYDLKGTTEDRWVDPATRGVMKDNNFLSQSLLFEADLCADVTQQILDDAEFLHSLGVMDYSLLVGISPPVSDSDPVLREGLSELPGWLAVAGGKTSPKLFQVGIIDYLQRWTPKKVAAHWLKKATLGCFHEIDTEPPLVYCNRFYKYFLRKIQTMPQ